MSGRGRGVLVHEWLAKAGGSENVFEAMNEIYPDADKVCLWNDSTGRFDSDQLQETWLARTPLRRNKAAALPFMPSTWRHLPFRDYDWALISSHLFAHHAHFVGQPADFERFVYVHTPARYIWNPEFDGRGNSRTARAVAAALKPLDRRRAQEGASFAANSEFVRERIKAAWGVDSRVIFPPVEVETLQSVADWRTRLTDAEQAQLAELPEGFILGASRFIPYKRLDLVIAAGEVANRPVVLAGRGPELENLRAVANAASVPVTFVHSPSCEMLWALYQQTALYVFPAIEDFGIMPVEAMAAGARVLAQAVGGTSESVVPEETGALISFRSRAEMAEGVKLALGAGREGCVLRAKDFSRRRFEERIAEWIGR